MATLDRAKATANNYLEDIISTIHIRQSFNDLIVSQSASLFTAFAQNSEAKSKLKMALKHKDTDTNSLYMALIVQVNGVFEQYIRAFVAAVIHRKHTQFIKYSEINETFRNDYVVHSAKVLSFLKKGDVNGQTYDFDSLITSLALCFTDQAGFYINPKVFTILMGNCTPDRLEKLFNVLSLSEPFSNDIGENPKLKKRMKETGKARVAKMARVELARQLELRNRIVHGDLRPAVTLTDLNESVEFFSALIDVFDTLARR